MVGLGSSSRSGAKIARGSWIEEDRNDYADPHGKSIRERLAPGRGYED
jgi:hypothetical protein